jgi:hypothetical protein
LRFAVGEVDALPEWREETAPAPPPLEVVREARADLDAPLHAALSQITDDELRTRMTQLLERAAARPKSVSPRRG